MKKHFRMSRDTVAIVVKMENLTWKTVFSDFRSHRYSWTPSFHCGPLAFNVPPHLIGYPLTYMRHTCIFCFVPMPKVLVFGVFCSMSIKFNLSTNL